jgi:hypothetical protein
MWLHLNLQALEAYPRYYLIDNFMRQVPMGSNGHECPTVSRRSEGYNVMVSRLNCTNFCNGILFY